MKLSPFVVTVPLVPKIVISAWSVLLYGSLAPLMVMPVTSPTDPSEEDAIHLPISTFVYVLVQEA